MQCERLKKKKFDFMECFIPNGPFEIKDYPQYTYRSILVDTSRNFIQTHKLKEVIELMGQVKLNVLHLHLTDTNGWTYEVTELPFLTAAQEKRGDTYSREEIRDLVRFASIRGVKIMPEIDTPSHAPMDLEDDEIQLKFGNLVKCTSLKYSTTDYAVEPPSGMWNITNPNSTEVLRKVWNQAIEDFSTAPYYHLGGDEVNINCSAVGTPFEYSIAEVKKNYSRESVGKFLTNLTNILSDNDKRNINFMFFSDWMSTNDFNVPRPNHTALTLWKYYPNLEYNYYKN